jgi:hypothetical protein
VKEATDTPTSELGRITTALALGDTAYTVTLVDRYGAAIAQSLRQGGVAHDDVEGAVHDVAFALLGAPAGCRPLGGRRAGHRVGPLG